MGSATGATVAIEAMSAPAGRRMAVAGARMVQQSSMFTLLLGVPAALQCAFSLYTLPDIE